MKKKANYMILPELKLILECFKGDATDDESAQMIMAEVSDPLFNPTYNVIVDFREFETFINNTTFESIAAFVHYLKALKVQNKGAFLTTKPHQVVVVEYLKQLFTQQMHLNIEAFSTIEACIKYLGYSDNDLPEIKRNIEKLNKLTG
jgi:hypothetical protein